MKILYSSFLVFILSFGILHAEGTHELAPNDSISIRGNSTTDVAALLINHDAYGNFAHLRSTDKYSQLFINIQDPSKECIFLGFSPGHINITSPFPPQVSFSFVIKDPNGNTVYGPILIEPSTANITSWQEAFNGPEPLVGSNGYTPIVINSSDLQSQGWSGAGNYYIQFEAGLEGQGLLIDFWDITVANCSKSTPSAEKGRIWSYNWALFAINDYGFPVRPFNGAFYPCAPSPIDSNRAFVTKIDFNGSGFKPAAFNIAFNSFGTRQTGDIAFDRRSVQLANATTPEYPIFLNDPVDIYKTVIPGKLEFLSIQRCNVQNLCVNVIPTSAGQVEVLIDLNGNDGIYTENSTDVLLTYQVDDSLVGTEICIPWDGLDGMGNIVSTDSVPIVLNYRQGVFHFPIYDAELLLNGYIINRIRPSSPDPLLYYDDTEITVPSGSGEPDINLNGCTMPCHSWTNYFGSTFVGFGNLNTINSWWFSNTDKISINTPLPNELICSLNPPAPMCYDRIDTIFVTLDTLGPAGISQVEYNWSGPSIVSTTDNYALIHGPGIYTLDLNYINNLGNTCSHQCSIKVINGPECCPISMSCPDKNTAIKISCITELLDTLETLSDFLAAGFQIGDTSCIYFASTMIQSTDTGKGCSGDPMHIYRNYTLFHDINLNGTVDIDEPSIQCTRTILLIDTTAASIHFKKPDLIGYTSGDTLQFQCHAGEMDWELPQFNVDDVAVANVCSGITLDFTMSKIAEGDCSTDGFLTQYRLLWEARDSCGNTASIFLVLEVVDTITPQFTSTPRDTVVYCSGDVFIPPPSYEEECCCSSLEYIDDYGQCNNGKIELVRTWIVTDECGNSNSMQENITVIDTTAPVLEFLAGEFTDSAHLTVECHRGGFPEDIEKWNAESVNIIGDCGNAEVRLDKVFLSNGNCTTTGLEHWKFIWTARDLCGRRAEFVLFIDVVDNTPPTIQIPEDNCKQFPPLDRYYVSDNCGIPKVQVEVDTIDTYNCRGAQKRRYTYTATDRCGNTTSISHIYTIGDTIAPEISLPGYQLGDDNTLVIACNSDIDISRLYSDDAISVSSDCSGIKAQYFRPVSSSSGHCINKVVKTDVLEWNVVDNCGNHAQLRIKVQYIDKQAPIIKDFKDSITVDCPQSLPEYTEFLDCTEAYILSDVFNYTEKCQQQNTGERIITISDACGNIATYHQSVMVDRRITIEILNAKKVICESDKDITPILYDHCYDTIIEGRLIKVKPANTCTEYFSEIRIWELENICGGSRIFRQKVLKKDIPAPEMHIFHPELGDISSATEIRLNCGDEGLTIANLDIDDPCSIWETSLEIVPVQENCKNGIARIIDYIYSIQNPCGEKYSHTITAKFIDKTPPILTGIPADVTITCTDSIPVADVSASDNCSKVDITYREIPYTQTGKPGLTRIWIARDACGNVSTGRQVITQTDGIDCYIEVPDNIDCWSSTKVQVYVNGGQEPYQYNWEVTNGQCLIEKSTDSSVVYVTVLSDSVEITVTIIDENGCSTECSVTIACNEGNAFQDEEGNGIILRSDAREKLYIYPNPSSTTLNIAATTTISYVGIYSMRGQKLKTYHPASANLRLRHNLAPGMYILEVRTENKLYHSKIIIQ